MPGFTTLTPYQYNRPTPQQRGGGYYRRLQQRGGAIPHEDWFEERTRDTPNIQQMFLAFARELMDKLQQLKQRAADNPHNFTEQQREDIDWHIERMQSVVDIAIADADDDTWYAHHSGAIVLADIFVKSFDKKS